MRTNISSKKRKKLMELILGNPERVPGVREAAKECGLSPALVSVFISELAGEGFIKRGKLDLGNPELRALRVLFNVEKVAPAYEAIRKEFGATGMGIYGSWASGTNTVASDLDIWVRVKDEKKRVEIRERLQGLIKGVRVEAVLLTEGKIAEMKEKNPVFYSALFYSFLIGGERVA
jgi:predicted nucleotidyltransferase